MFNHIKDVRFNILDISNISSFMNINGGYRNECKDVYFLRITGFNNDILKDIKNMDKTLTERMNRKACIYNRISSLSSMNDSEFYTDSFNNWTESGKKEIYTKICTDKTPDIAAMLGSACSKVIELYAHNKQNNPSIEKNLISKLLFWFDETIGSRIADWDPRQPAKIAADNITKNHEYMFFYMLTLIGFDVLLIQTKADINNDLDKLNLSKKVFAGDFNENSNIPEYKPEGSFDSVQPTLTQPSLSAAVNPNPPGVTHGSNNITAAANSEHSTVRISAQKAIKPDKNGMAAGVAGSQSREKSYEELALLSSSVVLITLHDTAGQVLGTGSGIMIGKNGFILTNHHVACRGTLLSVTIEDDNQVYETDEIIKYNHHLDLALIRINRQLNPIPIYKNNKKLVRGQKVVAIGSPLGLFNSVSDGIISGFRTLNGVEMIQFTAPISQGSSGGALLNMNGEVIGISTAGMDHGQNINLAVGYEYINSFIQGFINY